MPDIADIAQRHTEFFLDNALRAARAVVPPGAPGRCEECGDETARIVDGRCAPCREPAPEPRRG